MEVVVGMVVMGEVDLEVVEVVMELELMVVDPLVVEVDILLLEVTVVDEELEVAEVMEKEQMQIILVLQVLLLVELVV